MLNLSVGSPDHDPVPDRLIEKCIEKGVIVVAAMGDHESEQPVYPAVTKGVIAVGAVTSHDRPLKDSNYGNHAFIAAPGQSIATVQDRKQDGMACN